MSDFTKYRLARTWAHADSIHNIAISPNGRYLACSSNDYKLSIYDLSVGMLLREYMVMDHAVGLAWGDDSSQLFVACLRGEVFLYQGVTRSRLVAFILSWLLHSKTVTELANLRAVVRDIAYDPAARRLFISHEQRVSVLDRSTDKSWTTRLLPFASIRYIWGQKGRNFDLTSVIVPRPIAGAHSLTSKVYVVDMSYGIHLYEVDNKGAIEKWDISGRRSGGAGISPDGRYMACWNLCSNIYVYDLELQQCVQTIDVQEIVNDYDNVELYVQFIHHGRALVIGSNHGRPCIIDLSEKKVVDQLLHCTANALVPYVAYSYYKGMNIIITADTGRGEETKVKMWRQGTTQWLASSFVQSLVGFASDGFWVIWALLIQLFLLSLCLTGGVLFYYAYSTVSQFTVESSDGFGYGLVDNAHAKFVSMGKSLSEHYNAIGAEHRAADGIDEDVKPMYHAIVSYATNEHSRRGHEAIVAFNPNPAGEARATGSKEVVAANVVQHAVDVVDHGQRPPASEGGTEGSRPQLGWDVGKTPMGTEAPAQGWAITRFAVGVWEGMRA